MKKLLFAAIITVIAAIVLLPCMALALTIPGGVITGTVPLNYVETVFFGGATVTQSTYAALHGTGNYYKYTVKLTQNVEAAQEIAITQYGNVEIDLNGYTLKAAPGVETLLSVKTSASSISDAILSVKGAGGSKITSGVCDTVSVSGLHAAFKMNVAPNSGNHVTVENTGTDGCAITVSDRGEVYLNDGTLSMTNQNSSKAALYYEGEHDYVALKNVSVSSLADYGIQSDDKYTIITILKGENSYDDKAYSFTGKVKALDVKYLTIDDGLALKAGDTAYSRGSATDVSLSGEVVCHPVYKLSLPASTTGGSVSAAAATPLAQTFVPTSSALSSLLSGGAVNITFMRDADSYFVSAKLAGVADITRKDIKNGVYTFDIPKKNVSLTDVVYQKLEPKPFYMTDDYGLVTAQYDNLVGGFVRILSRSNIPAGAPVSVTIGSDSLRKPKIGNSGDCCRYEYTPSGEGQSKQTVYVTSSDYKFIMPDAETHFYAVYEAASQSVRTVTFYDGDGAFDSRSPQKPQFLADGQKAVKPADPAKGDIVFIGWTTDKACKNLYDFDTTLTGGGLGTGASFTIPDAVGGTEDHFLCRASYDKLESVDSQVAKVTYSYKYKMVIETQPEAEKLIYAGIREYLSDITSVTAAVQPANQALSPVYEWFECDANGNITGEAVCSGGKLTLSEFPAAGEHYYLCVASCEDCADVKSNVSKITVAPAPDDRKLSFAVQPSVTTTAWQGEIDKSLYASAANPQPLLGEPALNWYACSKNGVITGASLAVGGEFAIPENLAAGTYYYVCEATLAWAVSAKSNVATVFVLESTPALSPQSVEFIAHPEDTTVSPGEDTRYLVALAVVRPAELRLTPEYDWYRCDAGGKVIGESLGTGESFAVAPREAYAREYYLCRASYEGLQPVDSKVATVTFNGKPSINSGFINNPYILANDKIGYMTYSFDFSQYATGTEPIMWRCEGDNIGPEGSIFASNGIFYNIDVNASQADRQYTITVIAENEYGSDQMEVTYWLYSDAALPYIANPNPPRGTVGTPYSYQLKTNVPSQYAVAFSVLNELPPGLELNGETGLISGTPEQTGRYTLSVSSLNTTINRKRNNNEFITIVIGETGPSAGGDALAPLMSIAAIGVGGEMQIDVTSGTSKTFIGTAPTRASPR